MNDTEYPHETIYRHGMDFVVNLILVATVIYVMLKVLWRVFITRQGVTIN
jgi:hypothetical protein